MPESEHAKQTTDPFTQLWTDMMGRMAGAAAVPIPTPGTDFNEQMRKTFFTALSDYSEKYMRSEQFLASMKQMMDNSLALKQQINQFLTGSLQAAQMPSRTDTDHIVLQLRGLEQRVMGKLDALTDRIDALEATSNGKPKRAQGSKQK